MPALTSIRTSEGKLEIVNQLLLPHTVEFIEVSTIAEAYDAIKSMDVELPDDESEDFVDLMHKLLEKDPDKRIKMAELRVRIASVSKPDASG